MADPWVSLLIGGTVLLVGFAAYLVFQRYHVPDFFLLMVLGAALGQVPVAPFGPELLPSLGSLLPLFTQLTVAFILFEGGLSLRLRKAGRGLGALLVHIAVAFGVTLLLVWLVAETVFGLGDVASLALAAALAGPSASIALSFAPRMRLSERTEAGVILEGVLTNVFAVMGVLFVLRWYGGAVGNLAAYAAEVGLSVALAAGVGVVWRVATARLSGREFVYIASLALAIVVYAAAQGLLYGNGAVAVFLFGLVLGYRRKDAPADVEPEAAGEFKRPSTDLKSFQSEVTFALRTFFFVYLGLLLTAEWSGTASLVPGGLLVLLFIVARVPTSLGVGRVLRMPRRERRVLMATMGRGMTDTILVLLAVQSGLLPTAEATFLLQILPTTVLLSAIVCAILLAWAARTPAPLVAALPRTAAADGGSPAAAPRAPPPPLPSPEDTEDESGELDDLAPKESASFHRI